MVALTNPPADGVHARFCLGDDPLGLLFKELDYRLVLHDVPDSRNASVDRDGRIADAGLED